MTYFLVFLAMTGLDFIWAEYTLAVSRGIVLYAGILASLIIVLGAGVTISYVHDSWALIPAAIGAFTGTVASCLIRKPSKP